MRCTREDIVSDKCTIYLFYISPTGLFIQFETGHTDLVLVGATVVHSNLSYVGLHCTTATELELDI